MTDFSAILKELRAERAKLDAAITSIEALNGSKKPAAKSPATAFEFGANKQKPKRKLSAAGRKAIAAAAKARWAKVRASSPKEK